MVKLRFMFRKLAVLGLSATMMFGTMPASVFAVEIKDADVVVEESSLFTEDKAESLTAEENAGDTFEAVDDGNLNVDKEEENVSADEEVSETSEASDSVTADGAAQATAWNETDRLPEEAGSYKLMNDVKLSDIWYVRSEISLDLNGHSIDRGFPEDTEWGFVIVIYDDVTLTLSNSNTEKNGVITGGIRNSGDGNIGGGVHIHGKLIMHNGVEISGNKGIGVVMEPDAMFVMNGGKISGNTDDSGAGVYVSGEFIMKDSAEISNNTNGGVFVNDNGKFTMNGGNIAENGGYGVSVYGTFAMTGGKISGNNAGVTVGWDGIFNMSGGAEISGNTTENHGGGVYVGSNGTFNMGGNATIKGNTAKINGGGVAVVDNGVFTMSEHAKICGNTSEQAGGGAWVYNGTFNMSGNASIYDNNAGGGGGIFVNYSRSTMSGNTVISGNKSETAGGVFVNSNSVFNMSENAAICDNTATANNGGVYVSQATFTMSDDARISGNVGNYGAGIRADKSTITMTGGSITGNKASKIAGGVYIHYQTKFTMTGGSVVGNSSDSTFGGIKCDEDTEFIISGKPVIRDNFIGGVKSSDGLYKDGTRSDLCTIYKEAGVNGALTDGAVVYVNGELGKLIAQGSNGYTLTDSDVAKFKINNEADGKEFFFDFTDGKLYLKARFTDTEFTRSLNPGEAGSVDLSGFYKDGVTVGDISISDESGILKPGAAITDKVLNFEINDDRSLIGKSAVISIPVSGEGYEACTVKVTINMILENYTIVAGQKLNIKEACFPGAEGTISKYVVDNTKIAAVSKGMLTGKKAGTVKVTAQNQSGETIGECTITVLGKPKLKISKPMTYIGQTFNANDYLQAEDIKTLGATYWESSKPGVVEVTDPSAGTLVARGEGTTKITAYFGEKGKKGTVKISASLSVKKPSFKKTSYNVKTGGKLTLTMNNVKGSLDPVWETEDGRIAVADAQINKKGAKTGKVIVSGLKTGNTQLKAIIDGQEYTCEIHVTAPTISKTKLKVKVNKTATISLKNTKLSKSGIEWYSTNPSVATVSTGGKIKGISKGEAIIYTEAGGVRNECVVTVK